MILHNALPFADNLLAEDMKQLIPVADLSDHRLQSLNSRVVEQIVRVVDKVINGLLMLNNLLSVSLQTLKLLTFCLHCVQEFLVSKDILKMLEPVMMLGQIIIELLPVGQSLLNVYLHILNDRQVCLPGLFGLSHLNLKLFTAPLGCALHHFGKHGLQLLHPGLSL